MPYWITIDEYSNMNHQMLDAFNNIGYSDYEHFFNVFSKYLCTPLDSIPNQKTSQSENNPIMSLGYLATHAAHLDGSQRNRSHWLKAEATGSAVFRFQALQAPGQDVWLLVEGDGRDLHSWRTADFCQRLLDFIQQIFDVWTFSLRQGFYNRAYDSDDLTLNAALQICSFPVPNHGQSAGKLEDGFEVYGPPGTAFCCFNVLRKQGV